MGDGKRSQVDRETKMKEERYTSMSVSGVNKRVLVVFKETVIKEEDLDRSLGFWV